MNFDHNLLSKLENAIKSVELPETPELLYDPLRYIMEDGGKRMRPILMLLSAAVFKDDIEDIYKPAIALEVFHNFTLLHDDIMDKADIRRGRDTVHKKWSENVAILSGDVMVILAYKLMLQAVPTDKLAQTLEVFNKASIEVCEGQQFDMDFENIDNVTIDDYLNMIRLKTSVLMAAATQIGALLAGANQAQQKAFYDFGVLFGLAFQIQDDILDTYGDKDTFGKKIGGDIAVGKKTFLFINAYNKADNAQRKVLKESRDFDEVRAIYDALNIKELADKAVQNFFERSINSLQTTELDSRKLEGLMDYATSLLNREK